jgi:Lar family restriction alleviation protein
MNKTNNGATDKNNDKNSRIDTHTRVLLNKWLYCPFCGNAELHMDYEPTQKSYSILCGCCYARGPLFDTRNEAIEGWNDRTLGHQCLKNNQVIK